MGVFEKVILGFLPVGHTHEDIDQMFSRLAVYLHKHRAFSPEELAVCVQRSYRKDEERPTVAHWTSVANISDWMKPYAVDFKDHTRFRHFKFSRLSNGKVVMMVCISLFRSLIMIVFECVCEQVRSAPTGDAMRDPWRGIHDNQLHTELWKGATPNLKRDLRLKHIPPCQRSQASQNAEVFNTQLEKIKKGLSDLKQHLPTFSDTHYDACMAIVHLMETPNATPIPCPWTLQVSVFVSSITLDIRA